MHTCTHTLNIQTYIHTHAHVSLCTLQQVWTALDEFELLAGDVAQDRHTSALAAVGALSAALQAAVGIWSSATAQQALQLIELEVARHKERVTFLAVCTAAMGGSAEQSADYAQVRRTLNNLTGMLQACYS